MSDFDKTFLTIAIPTYNRPEQIQRQVRNLLPQLIPGKTRLLVSDNASPIPVETLFTDEEKSLFVIHRNAVNIGGDANIARCFEACCDSEWGYVPGDDDELFTDVIARITKQIEYNPDAVFINFGCKKEERLESEADYLRSLSNNFISFGDALWISKGVYHTRILYECYSDLYQYAFSYAPQVIFVLSYLKKNKNGVVIRSNTPLFEKSSLGSWNPFVFANRLMSFYVFFDSCNMYYRNFLRMIMHLQLYNVFLTIHARPNILTPASKDVRILLKQIFCFFSFTTCMKECPALLLNAILYSIAPRTNMRLYRFYYEYILPIRITHRQPYITK